MSHASYVSYSLSNEYEEAFLENSEKLIMPMLIFNRLSLMNINYNEKHSHVDSCLYKAGSSNFVSNRLIDYNLNASETVPFSRVDDQAEM